MKGFAGGGICNRQELFEASLEAPLGTQGKRGKQCKHFEAQCKQTRWRIARKYSTVNYFLHIIRTGP
jgi:hypothetical protein